MKKYIFITIFIILIVIFSLLLLVIPNIFKTNMIPQEQPVLTKNELDYFRKIRNDCNCSVERYVSYDKSNPVTTIRSYMIALDSVSCEKVLNKDSLKVVSLTMAKNIYKNIVKVGFQDNYSQMQYEFCCNCPENLL